MDNLCMFLNNFEETPLIIAGDMNARFGTQLPISSLEITYKDNPDTEMNSNGRSLLKILENNKKFHILNGIQINNKNFDTDFTFFRGKLHSQNDICLSNNIDMIESFSILEKNVYSEHKPCIVEINTVPKASLRIISNCASNTFKHDHYDINKKLKKPVKLSQLDVQGTIKSLEQCAITLANFVQDVNVYTDKLCHEITNTIYKTCMENKKYNNATIAENIPNASTCSSKNFRAIANANFKMYEQLASENKSKDEYKPYLE